MTGTPASSRGGGGGSVTAIADVTLGVDAASFDLTSIPQTYAHLKLICYLRTAVVAVGDTIRYRFNNDSGANYGTEYLFGSGATAGAALEAATQTSMNAAKVPGASATANRFGLFELTVPHYANTANNKVGLTSGGSHPASEVDLETAIWLSNAAISRITIFSLNAANLVAGSRVTLYGLAAS